MLAAPATSMVTAGSARTLPLALSLAAVSGAAGLAHQLVWTRRLVDVLGAGPDTFSRVIGAFFAGLALGSWMASRQKPAAFGEWRRAAIAELAVGLLALPAMFSASLAESLWTLGAGPAMVRWILPLVLVLPPAIAMGWVMPCAVRALSVTPQFHPSHPVWMYSVNTLGGIAGIGWVVLGGLPLLGLTGASLSAVLLSAVASCLAWTLSNAGNVRPPRPVDATGRRAPKADNEAAAGMPSVPPAVMAFASGFFVLAMEVVLQHQFAQVTINSLFSSAIVLSVLLISLALAAILVPGITRRTGGSPATLGWALVAACVLCCLQPFLLLGLRDGVRILPYELNPLPYVLAVSGLGLIAVSPAAVACGLVFPLLLRSVVTSGSMRSVGLLFAWNGLGGWIGAEWAQAWLAPTLGLWRSMALLGAGYAALWAAWMVWQRGASATGSQQAGSDRNPVPWAGVAIGLGMAVATGFVAAGWLPQVTLGPREKLHALAVGREGAVATVEAGSGDWRILFNNSYTLGGSRAQFNQERQGLLPLLIHGRARSVATLGVATGSTLAGAARDPVIERLDGIELSPLVLRFAAEHFGPYNREVLHDPRVRLHAEDARWVVAMHPDQWDVVVGDLFLPWRTGEGRLFTREHFENVRRSLRPGGLYCQWLPLFQLTRPQYETIARTFQSVFPDAFLIRGDFYVDLPILGLVGGRRFGEMDWDAVAEGCARLRGANLTGDPLLRHADGVAMALLGPLPRFPEGATNTLANAWLEWDAGRNILGMRTPWYVGIPFAEHVRDVQRSGVSLLPQNRRDAQESGQFFLTLEVASRLGLPAFDSMKAQSAFRLPPALREDPDAVWVHWPMRAKGVAGQLGRGP